MRWKYTNTKTEECFVNFYFKRKNAVTYIYEKFLDNIINKQTNE